ncbi:cache domain-containing protein [Rhizobium cremeum]|uniref:sensor histidine kinase n=1 Tax=Rhizobium cremeum TaxID=2813827 RepID=UPI000DDABEF4|nr:cache domain-containing protein [Rhizobium cremeum]MCJ7995362.1 cache domain-containing protein [Rhizobium cremeum]MCJ8000861.1 cache domain-containing protein [Rhizobium cremeum]
MAEHASDKVASRGVSIRVRLLAIALLPTLVILPLLLVATMARWEGKFDALLISKVNGDLTIAHQYLLRILENTGEHLNALSESVALRDAASSSRETGSLANYLRESRERLKLDFLFLVEPDGRIIGSVDTPSSTAIRTDWPVMASAFAGRPSTAIDILSHEELAAISPALAKRASLDLVPTPNAVPTDRTAETRGMVVHSASPVNVPGLEGAAIVGGILLNQNLEFIDTINDLVYRKASLPEGSQGTATLFLDDVRISTNVRLFEDKRALGTRVSAAVRSAVLDEGRVWLDSAFVVNDWYVSAYEPVRDSFGNRVGMLYVGFLEAPFSRAKMETIIGIAIAFLLVTAASVPIFLRWARSIFKPLERMTGTIAAVESGDLGARTRLENPRDEIGVVSAHLDHLLDQLQDRDRELRAWNDELNDRVAERTRELELANQQLEATTKQLIMSEKLAAIGEITAGVAHEMNNPIAVMQGNLEVVRSVLDDRATEVATELRLIDEQIHRMTLIVNKLLQFARPEEYAGFLERHAAAEVISDCLPLVQYLLNKADIRVEREDTATRLLLMNRTELQQVLVNLIVNAIHAMPNGGTLRLASRDEQRDSRPGVTIEVSDTGIGMAPDLIERIFDPFFTTKRSEGTGLGLSISQTLIDRQGGALSVESTVGAGTTFLLWLPEAD